MILPLLMHLMAISVVVVCAVVGANSTCTSARPNIASNEVAHWATKGSPEPRRVTKLAHPITRLARSGAGCAGRVRRRSPDRRQGRVISARGAESKLPIGTSFSRRRRAVLRVRANSGGNVGKLDFTERAARHRGFARFPLH